MFVYAGGHGATDEEKQIFLLNSNDANQAQFKLELKLRMIIGDSLSLGRIFAVYDCCRVPLRNFPGLDPR